MREIESVISSLVNTRTIESASGRVIDVFNPTEDMFDIHDIATALCKISRFNGNIRTKKPYTVGQHSIWVCEQLLLNNSPHAFSGLMHDVTEAFICDIPKPIKDHLPEYLALEKHLDSHMSKVFGYTTPKPADVNYFDEQALYWEYAMFKHHENSQLVNDVDTNINRFLELYYELKPDNKQPTRY